MNANPTMIVHTIVTAIALLPSVFLFVRPVSVAVLLHARQSITTPSVVVLKDIPETLVSNVINVSFFLFRIILSRIVEYLYISNISTVAGCRSNNDCPAKEACINGQCVNPCRCGVGAVCEIRDHNPICKCPPGTVGNPSSGCTCNYYYKNHNKITKKTIIFFQQPL